MNKVLVLSIFVGITSCLRADEFCVQTPYHPIIISTDQEKRPYITYNIETLRNSFTCESCNLAGQDLRAIIAEFNAKNKNHPQVPDCNLQNTDLSGANLSGSDLTRCDLRSSNLTACDVSSSKLHNITCINGSGAIMRNAQVTDDIAFSTFTSAHLQGINLHHTEIMTTDFSQAHCENANFSNANLVNINFVGAHLDCADFSGAKLTDVDLRNASLFNVQFKDADISENVIISHDPDLKEVEFENTIVNQTIAQYLQSINRNNFFIEPYQQPANTLARLFLYIRGKAKYRVSSQ